MNDILTTGKGDTMFRVSCKEVTGDRCEFVAVGKKARHLRARMLDHLRVAHPETVAGIDCEQLADLEDRIKSGTRSESLA